MEKKDEYSHPYYKHCDKKDADALAWAFLDKERMVEFPFKFPEIAPTELRINVLYVGLCQSDVLTVRSKWGNCPFYPIAPGHEIVGEVVKVGSSVTDFKIGDKVGFGTRRYACGECFQCKKGLENQCAIKIKRMTYGGYFWGGYATQMQQPADHFFKLPENFNLEKGAPIFCAGITTFSPMKKFLKDGMRGAVCGVGGLGHMAVQFLHKLGHKVTGLTQSPDKKDLIMSLGADDVIITTDEEQMKKAYDSFDFIINTLPVNKMYNELCNLCAPGGYVVQVGEPDIENDVVSFHANTIVAKELNLVGSLVGTRPVIKEMLQICVDKNIYPMVEIFPFEEFPKAFHRLEKERPKFRCVVNVKDFAEKNGWNKK